MIPHTPLIPNWLSVRVLPALMKSVKFYLGKAADFIKIAAKYNKVILTHHNNTLSNNYVVHFLYRV